MRRALPLALLAALLVPVPVGADHVYSHRYVVEGRLLGSDGAPLPNRTVEFFSLGEDFAEPCQGGHRNVTDEMGDFRFCFHKHGVNASSEIGVRAGNASETRHVDTAHRKSTFILEEVNETGVATERWNVTHLVAGRVWRTGGRELEGVPVVGYALADTPVNITLRTPNGTESRFDVRTDGYGDFRAELRLVDPIPADTVSVDVEAMGQKHTRALDPRTHRVTVSFFLPPEGSQVPPPSFLTPPTPHPGTGTPQLSPWLVLAVVAALGLTVYMTWRGHNKRG